MAQLNERIAALEEKLKHLRARQQKDDARKRSIDSRRTRKADTRRKILIGAVVLLTWLDQALSLSDDRELFQLSRASTTVQSPNLTERGQK